MSNSDAKSAIFASIRQNLAASLPFDELHKAHRGQSADLDFSATFINELTQETLIENFRKSLEFVGGKFDLVYDESEAAEIVLAIVSEKKARKIAVSNSPLVKKIVGFLKIDAEFIENASADVLFESDLGITSAQWAIAETGTLVLESEKENHRLASLVPPVHVCVLEAKQIRQSLGEILTILQNDLNRAITFITGASRTSDIELTLAVGVHGPGELNVIVLESEPSSITDG